MFYKKVTLKSLWHVMMVLQKNRQLFIMIGIFVLPVFMYIKQNESLEERISKV